MIYTYIRPIAAVQEEFKNYVARHFIAEQVHIENTQDPRSSWKDTDLFLLGKTLKAEDLIVTFDASHLSCSMTQTLEILKFLTDLKVNLYFMKYDFWLNQEMDNAQHLLKLISVIHKDFLSQRTINLLERRRAAGLPLGRPKGVKNSSLKLDKFKPEIEKYLGLGISKSSIAKLLDCHPQTLHDWIGRSGYGGGESCI